MGNGADSKSGLADFLKQLSAPILAFISLVSGIYGFVKLFAEKDAGLLTLVSLSVGIVLLVGVCLYYARFWKPEKQDKSPSAFAPVVSDQQVKAQRTKEQQRTLIRRSALAGLILIPFLTIAGFAGWQYVQNLPTKDVMILVADFEGPDLQSHNVTGRIFKNLQEATNEYTDVKVELLGKAISDKQGSKVARQEGEARKAAIVIWGWYTKIEDTISVSTNFELLRQPEDFPELGEDARGKIRTASIAEVKSFRLQTRLSQEMTYLTLVTLGMSRYAADDWDGAIARLTDALEQMKDPVQALNQHTVFLFRGAAHGHKKDYDREIADYSQAIKLKPDYSGAYNNRGIAYSSKKDYDQEIADYTKAIQINKNWGDFKPSYFGLPTAYNNRGLAYFDKKDYERAIADFTQAIKLKPDYAGAYYNRGWIYSEKKDYNRAISDLTQVIKLKPDDADAYRSRGLTYYDKKNYEQAISDLAQAIKLKPDNASYYYNRGIAHHAKKDYDRAIADSTQSLKLKPDDALAYYNRGNAYTDKKDYDRAISDFTQSLKLKPDDAHAYSNRGWIYSEKKDYNRAIADYTQVLKLQPDDAHAYNGRGVAYSELKEYDKAIQDLNQALKLKSDYAAAYDSRGTMYRYMKDYNQALRDYNQAIKLDPKTQDVSYLWRGVIYREQGNKQNAVKDFKKVLELAKDPEFRRRAEQELKRL